MSSQFQIVFRGEILDGFELAAVQASAQRRLKAPPEQLQRVFSGKRAVLKKGLTEELAARYASELERVGMRVSIEPETVKVTTAVSADAAFDPIGAIDPVFTSTPISNEPQRVTSRDEPVFDPQKTQLSAIAPEDEPPPPPERWSQPTIAVSHKHLNSAQSDNDSSAPTLIVPPRKSGPSDPTVVVTRGSSGTSASGPVVSSSFTPRIVMPTRDSGEASEPTMIVPPRHGASSEPTMIVSKGGSASDPTMIVPPRTSGGFQPTVIVRSDQKLPAAGASEPANDSEGGNTVSGEPEVQCPTCGDKQPKRVYCRRCGHALQMPPKPPAGESTVTITKRPFPRPPVAPPAAVPDAPQAMPQLEEIPPPEKKSAARKGFLAAPTWLTIGLMFVLLLAAAGWLIFS